MSISLKATGRTNKLCTFSKLEANSIAIRSVWKPKKESYELNQKFKKLVTLTKEKKVRVNIKEVAFLILFYHREIQL